MTPGAASNQPTVSKSRDAILLPMQRPYAATQAAAYGALHTREL
jgi:hypothetical protein